MGVIIVLLEFPSAQLDEEYPVIDNILCCPMSWIKKGHSTDGSSQNLCTSPSFKKKQSSHDATKQDKVDNNCKGL